MCGATQMARVVEGAALARTGRPAQRPIAARERAGDGSPLLAVAPHVVDHGGGRWSVQREEAILHLFSLFLFLVLTQFEESFELFDLDFEADDLVQSLLQI